MFGRRLEIPVNVFHHDDGGVDDDAEIDGAQRQQVGVFAPQHQYYDGKEKRERNVGADDDGASEIAEENPLDQEDQQATKPQIVQHGMRGHADQRAAIVVGHDLDAGGEAAVRIQPCDLGLDERDDVVGV